MIKFFEPGHLDDVMDIWLRSNISAHNFIDKSYWEKMYDPVKSLLPTAEIFIWQEAGTIKGFIGITDGIYIAGVFVDELYRSQGIGKKLLEFAKTRYSELEADVFSENTRAVHFYQNNGFKPVRTQTNPEFNREEYRMVWAKQIPDLI